MYVIAVRLSTGLKGRKCTSVMFARAYGQNDVFLLEKTTGHSAKGKKKTKNLMALFYFSSPPSDQQAC